jgi:hypothetical protein
LSVVLVVAGVSGELVIDSKLGRLETSIRDINEQRVLGLQKEAGDAARSAQSAKDDAKTAHALAQGASEIAEMAKTTAGEAKTAAVAVGRQAAHLTDQMSEAKQELANAEVAEQKEEQALLNMAICLAPRVIPQRGYFNPVTRAADWTTVDALRPYSALQAIIDVVPDAEARRAASNIERSLRTAGWTRVTTLRGVDGLKDGVEVIPWEPRIYGDKPEAERNRNLALHGAVSSAADAIVDWLDSFFWHATRSLAPSPDIPSDAIQINVGLYPAVQYAAPPGNGGFSTSEKALRKQQEDAQAKQKAEQDKKFDELMNSRIPEMVERARRERESMAGMERKREERYFSQPCRLVDSFKPFQ